MTMKNVTVCINHRSNPTLASCAGRGGGEVLAKRLEKEITAKGWNIKVERFSCLGHCEEGPVVKLSPCGPFICDINPDKLEELFQKIEAFSKLDDL